MYNHVSSDPLIGTLFGGRYLINFLVAKGGMGNIYHANDIRTGRIVAIKMLRSEFENDNIILRRFERETDAVSCLKHPNICQLFDSGRTSDGIHYFTMEYLVGQALDQKLKQERILAPEVAVNYITQVAAALCDAHNHGVIHRDLKPANIFIVHEADDKEVVKVLDFGVAKVDDDVQEIQEKLTRAGSTLGTPYYMSPEQLQGLDVDGRTDVYALGVIFWECLFGCPPFGGRSLIEIFDSTMHSKLPKLPPEYRKNVFWKRIYSVLCKALEKDCKQRYASMRDFLRALEKINVLPSKTHQRSMSTPKSLPVVSVIRKFHRLSPLKLVVFGAIAVLAFAGLVWLLIHWMSDPLEPHQSHFNTYKFFTDLPAEIMLDNENYGVTPVSVDLKRKVPFSVRFLARNVPEYSITVVEQTEMVMGYAVNLQQKHSEKPMIYVETIPAGAEVFVDGKSSSRVTPCAIEVNPPSASQVQLMLKYEGYQTEMIHVIPNGGDVKVRTNLFRP